MKELAFIKDTPYTAPLSVTNLGAYSSVTGTISIGAGTFTSAPIAYLGNILTKNGGYYKGMLVLEDVATTSITMRVINLAADVF